MACQVITQRGLVVRSWTFCAWKSGIDGVATLNYLPWGQMLVFFNFRLELQSPSIESLLVSVFKETGSNKELFGLVNNNRFVGDTRHLMILVMVVTCKILARYEEHSQFKFKNLYGCQNAIYMAFVFSMSCEYLWLSGTLAKR